MRDAFSQFSRKGDNFSKNHTTYPSILPLPLSLSLSLSLCLSGFPDPVKRALRSIIQDSISFQSSCFGSFQWFWRLSSWQAPLTNSLHRGIRAIRSVGVITLTQSIPFSSLSGIIYCLSLRRPCPLFPSFPAAMHFPMRVSNACLMRCGCLYPLILLANTRR